MVILWNWWRNCTLLFLWMSICKTTLEQIKNSIFNFSLSELTLQTAIFGFQNIVPNTYFVLFNHIKLIVILFGIHTFELSSLVYSVKTLYVRETCLKQLFVTTVNAIQPFTFFTKNSVGIFWTQLNLEQSFLQK